MMQQHTQYCSQFEIQTRLALLSAILQKQLSRYLPIPYNTDICSANLNKQDILISSICSQRCSEQERANTLGTKGDNHIYPFGLRSWGVWEACVFSGIGVLVDLRDSQSPVYSVKLGVLAGLRGQMSRKPCILSKNVQVQ